MDERTPGRWLMWGEGLMADVLSDVMASLGQALAAAPDSADPSSPGHYEAIGAHGDPSPTGPEQDAGDPDCGEGDLSDDLDDAELIALIHERDPDWTPPGSGDLNGTVSWMEIVRHATEVEARTKATARGARTRGLLRLD